MEDSIWRSEQHPSAPLPLSLSPSLSHPTLERIQFFIATKIDVGSFSAPDIEANIESWMGMTTKSLPIFLFFKYYQSVSRGRG